MSQYNQVPSNKKPQVEADYQSLDVDDDEGVATQYQAIPSLNQKPVLNQKPGESVYKAMHTDEEKNGYESMHTDEELGKPSLSLHASTALGKLSSKQQGLGLDTDSGEHYRLLLEFNDKQSEKLFKQNLMERKHRDTILGAGNFGTVYVAKQKAADHHPERFLAVKAIERNPELFAQEETLYEIARKRGLSEGLLMPVDTVYCQENDTLFQFTPLVNFGDGQKLLTVAANFPQHDREIILRHVMHQLLAVYSNLHEKKIYYLDLKPDNFLIDYSGHVFLNDFGAAVAFDETGSRLIYGPGMEIDIDGKVKVNSCTNSRYWSPEMNLFSSENEVLHQRADEWQLGLTLLQLACVKQESKTFIDQSLLITKRDRDQKTTEQQIDYFHSLKKKIEGVLIEENLPIDIQHIIKGLLNPDHQTRLMSKQGLQMLQTSPEDTIKARQIFASLAPKQATIESQLVLIPRKNLQLFTHLVEEMTQYKEKHAGPHFIDIKKQSVVDQILGILSQKTINDPTLVDDLKQIIATEEIQVRHRHFHNLKTRLGQDVSVIAQAKKMVSALEDKEGEGDGDHEHPSRN